MVLELENLEITHITQYYTLSQYIYIKILYTYIFFDVSCAFVRARVRVRARLRVCVRVYVRHANTCTHHILQLGCQSTAFPKTSPV